LSPSNILTILIVIPLLGLIPLVVFWRSRRAAYQVAIVTTAVEFVASLVMLARFKVGEAGFQMVESAPWLPSFGIRYELGVDGISVLLVVMTTLLTLISVVYSSGGAIKERVSEFVAAFLLLEVGMVGVFLALDLFLFYIFFELMLIPMYLIIGIWGGQRRVYARAYGEPCRLVMTRSTSSVATGLERMLVPRSACRVNVPGAIA